MEVSGLDSEQKRQGSSRQSIEKARIVYCGVEKDGVNNCVSCNPAMILPEWDNRQSGLLQVKIRRSLELRFSSSIQLT